MRPSAWSKPAWRAFGAAFWVMALVTIGGSPAGAQQVPLALRDSFPLGDARGSLCQVQSRSDDPANKDMFDRSWAIVCRDSARPVGYVFALRDSGGDPMARLATRRAANVDCDSAEPVATPLVADAQERRCRWRDGALEYTVASVPRGRVVYATEGFSAYDSALGLALQSIMADRIVPGTIEIATTSIGDPAAFARVQALTLAPAEALAEGYRRNNSGNYAEAAEFFETLQQRFADPADSNLKPEEFLANRALQRSNLGQFAEAELLFSEARALGSEDPVQQRLLRNFEAIHAINRGDYAGAIVRLDQPVGSAKASADALREEGRITAQISSRINSADSLAGALGFVDDQQLTVEERAYIIDAQGAQLRATAQRLMGDRDAARAGLVQALADVISVRNGRVVSIIRLRAQMMSELALVEEDAGNFGAARGWIDGALSLLELQYPETSIVNAMRARKAAFLVRQGEGDAAMALYRSVVTSALAERDALVGFGNQMAPYFDLLTARLPAQPALSGDLFDAMQILLRPGVAETQSILARELSGGDTEAARLFRQSLNLSRAIERQRIRLAVLERGEDRAETQRLAGALADELGTLEAAQQEALIRLAEYPQYRATSAGALPLATLQSNLGADEIYVKMAVIGSRIYMFYATHDGAGGYRADLDTAVLDRRVDAVRDTVSRFNGTRYETLPFDAEAARAIYRDLFGPIADRIETAQHMIFEPDGAMLRLPANLLITRDEPVAAFMARLDDLDSDPFDMTGMPWLGRIVDISTAVSARAFVDARGAPESHAPRQYLGMGQNRPVFDKTRFNIAQLEAQATDPSCRWSLSEWNRPINDAELRYVQSVLGTGNSQLVTGQDFADDEIIARPDLDQYRIVHFATHGLVTPPRTVCPARPALLTSFGGAGSDGLLSFQEIFDLKLDADIVILSACDTAARASVQATREAGLDSGGGAALDGLVRSFIGAGGRSVLASHWPAPDDFNATRRLITGLFAAQAGTSIADALLGAERELMDDALTSHPYYWAGFAIIGDGRRRLIQPGMVAAAPSAPGGAAATRSGGR